MPERDGNIVADDGVPHRALKQLPTLEFFCQCFGADKLVSMQAGIDRACYVGVCVVDEKSLVGMHAKLFETTKIGLRRRLRCPERSGRIHVRPEELRDGRIQITNIVSDQAAIVCQHRNPAAVGHFCGECEHFHVRRDRCMSGGQPVVAIDGAAQQAAQFAQVLVVADLSGVGARFESGPSDSVAHGVGRLT